jgi:hypothetical protein
MLRLGFLPRRRSLLIQRFDVVFAIPKLAITVVHRNRGCRGLGQTSSNRLSRRGSLAYPTNSFSKSQTGHSAT